MSEKNQAIGFCLTRIAGYEPYRENTMEIKEIATVYLTL